MVVSDFCIFFALRAFPPFLNHPIGPYWPTRQAEDWHRIVSVNDVTSNAKGMAQELCRHKVSAVSFAGNQQARYAMLCRVCRCFLWHEMAMKWRPPWWRLENSASVATVAIRTVIYPSCCWLESPSLSQLSALAQAGRSCWMSKVAGSMMERKSKWRVSVQVMVTYSEMC